MIYHLLIFSKHINIKKTQKENNDIFSHNCFRNQVLSNKDLIEFITMIEIYLKY